MATLVSNTFFSSPSYARSNGRPVLMEFGMETIPGDINWDQVKKQTPGNPIWIHRNASGFKKTKSGGAFAWLQNQQKHKMTAGWDGSPYLEDFYQNAKGAREMLAFGSVYKGFDDSVASWAPPGGRHIEQRCGQTWLKTFDVINKNFSASDPLPAMQLVTWNDYEEGTELETGIDNCVTVSAQVNSDVLTWSISGGKENTIDHYTVFVSNDGQHLMPLVEVEPGSRTLNLASFPLARGSYSIYVQAVGKASIRNQMSAAVSYSAAGGTGGSAIPSTLAHSDLDVQVNPGTVKVARGKSSAIDVTLKPKKRVSGKVLLACSNLPAGVSCAFSPAIISPGSSPANARLTVTANANHTAALRHQGGELFAFVFPGIGLMGMVVVGSSRRSRALIVGMLLVLILGLLALSGCGGGSPSLLSNGPAAAGTYEITVSAVSPTVKQFTTATLVIE